MKTDFLKQNPIFWSRSGFAYDPPLYDEDGFPLLFTRDFATFEKFHRDFSDAGIKIHSSLIHTGWVGIDKYDYRATDETLESIFSAGDDIYYIPRIKCNVPVEWCTANPEDVFVYDDGPRTLEEIKPLIGTLKQDWLGFKSETGYSWPGVFEDKRPNVDGVIGMQSFSSKKWLCDAGVALKKLIEHIENSKWADRIIGYHIGFGPGAECLYWGRPYNHYGDYGIEARRQFFDFGLSKYGDIGLLKEKWQQPDITRETVLVPSAKFRYDRNHSLKEFFRGSPQDVICNDFDEFLSKTVADAIEYFAKVVKDNTPDKFVGSFYGYFAHCANAQYAGHLAIDQLLESPYVDFLCAPFTYRRETAGEPSGSLTVVQSINRKKLWVEEIDCRTSLTQFGHSYASPDTDFDDSKIVFWREFCRNVSSDSGYWWMDLGGGWYDSPIFMNEIAKITDLSNKLRLLPYNSKSDVLIVADEKSCYRMGVNDDLLVSFLDDFTAEAHMSGALIDIYRLCDLSEIDLSQYKVIIFAYTFRIDKDFIESLNIPKTTTLMFNYASGIWDGDSCSLKNTENLTGFKLVEYSDESYTFPMLKTANGNLVEKALVNGRTHIINLKPMMEASELRSIFETAGAKIYAPLDCSVYGDNRIIGIFSRGAVKGTVDLHENATWCEAISGKIYNGSSFEIELPEKSGLVFYKKIL